MVAKPLPNQEITPTPEEANAGPRLVEPKALPERGTPTTAAEKVSQLKETVGDTIDDLKERSAQTLNEVRQSASEAYDQAKMKASDALQQARAKSAEAARRARVQTRNVMDNYPLHFLAGVAGVAFIAGVLLRIWRSSRYE